MSRKKLIIYGLKNFAEMSHHLFSTDSEYDVVAFTVDGEFLTEPNFKGLPVIPYEELQTHFPNDSADVFVAIGVNKQNSLRELKVKQLQRDGYRLASYVSSSAFVHGDLDVKPNTMIMDNTIVHPFVEIGTNTIIWSSSRIALKTRIGDNCWITAAIIGESTVIGDNTFIGINATIAPYITIGEKNVLGAGTLITRDSPANAVYRGVRSRRSRVPSQRLKNTF